MELREIPYARREPGLVVLENFHAVKHALRFGGHLLGAWTSDPEELARLSESLAPDVRIPAEVVDLAELKAVSPRGQVIAVARRPVQPDLAAVLAGPGHVVFLEEPRHLGNLGAVVRVAAAAGAGGVLTSGNQDPWHPDALRGSAGLHFALPVHRIRGGGSFFLRSGEGNRPTPLPASERELIALDPDGDPLDPGALPDRAILAFGTERHGLSEELLQRADRRVALPMAPGVSSMNLATAVAATLYALKLASR